MTWDEQEIDVTSRELVGLVDDLPTRLVLVSWAMTAGWSPERLLARVRGRTSDEPLLVMPGR